MAIDVAAGTVQPRLTPDDDADSTLVGRVRDGSADALATLYDRHVDAVYATAARVLGDRSLAGEVVQDTFMALWNRAELFDPVRGTLRAWLLTIARNRALDQIRAVERRGGLLPFSTFDGEDHGVTTAEWLTTTGRPLGMARPDVGPERALTVKEDEASVRAALDLLPEIERSVIDLAYAEDLSQAEIAVRLGWPIGTVKTRTRRALRHLREALEAHDFPEPAARSGGRQPITMPDCLESLVPCA